jgi:hypothetical protein
VEARIQGPALTENHGPVGPAGAFPRMNAPTSRRSTMSITLVPTTALIALVLLSGACGSGAGSESASASSPRRPADAGAKATVDICSLLTKEEIAAVTGSKVAESKTDSYGSVRVCNYTVTGELLPIVSLLLAPNMPDVASSADMAQWRSKQVKEGMSLGDLKPIIEPIGGLGVPAIRNEIEGMGMVTVEAAAKGRLLDVTTSSLEKSKTLAAKAMTRLP